MIGAMKLTDYVVEQGGTGTLQCLVLAGLAFKAECSPNTLYMIAKGHKLAGPKLAGRIETATRGSVTRHDLRPDVFGSGDVSRRSTAANQGDAAETDGTSIPLKNAA